MKKHINFLLIAFLLLGNLLWAKDIFVKPGAKGGNGAKTAPFGSISDAMNMGVYAGDVIHVANGIDYGEGGSGKWVVKVNNLTLVGGYNNDFSERNPWKYQTILVRGMSEDVLAEAKKRGHDKKWGLDFSITKASYNGGAIVSGTGSAANTIIDGFVIDGYTRNTYKKNGDLNTSVGPIGGGGSLVVFTQPGCKVRNCVIMNSGGPGITMIACGKKDDPNTWPEISNCVILNTLMEAVDFRAGTWDANNDPDGGYALIKNNTIAFVWSFVGEGYGLLIGRQTKLVIENNIIAFATDFGMNNGFGNDKAKLVNNVFFNNKGGVYRYFASSGSGTTIVVDDPLLLSGKQANKMYYLSAKSEGNVTGDPKLKVDPDFFDKFSNQIKSEGGGKVVWDDVNQWRSILGLPLIGSSGTGNQNFAPIYEHDYMLLFSDSVQSGARNNGQFEVYKSAAVENNDKDYASVKFEDLKKNYGKDVSVKTKIGDKNSSSFYVDGVTSDKYVCFYFKDDRMNYLYVKKGSEALEVVEKAVKEGATLILSGKVYDTSANIKSSNRYALVVDLAETDE